MNFHGAGPVGFRRLLGGLVVGALSACNLNNPGISPPEATVTFPVGLALSSESTPAYLYVANSNFDLRFNAGSVQAYDLEALTDELDRAGCLAQDSSAGTSDAGTLDPDAGALDAGASADAAVDAGTSDAGAGDAGEDASADAGDSVDAGPADAGADAAFADASDPVEGDAGLSDAGGDGSVAFSGTQLEPAPLLAPSQADGGEDLSALEERSCGTDVNSGCCFEGDDLKALLTHRGDGEAGRRGELLIDSYAAGIAVSPDGDRLYVPVRSRNRLVYVDVQDGALSCGDGEGRCTRGPDVDDRGDTDDESFAPAPTSVSSGRFSDLGLPGEGVFVLTAHERGQVSLLVESGGAPVLQDVLGGGSLRPSSARVDARTGLIYVGAASSSQVDRLAVESVDLEDTARVARMYRSSAISLATNVSNAVDVRDVVVDQKDGGPLEVFALVRGNASASIQSVAFLRYDPVTADAQGAEVFDLTRVGQGASKLLLHKQGERRFLLVSCYDAGAIYVLDADRRELIHVMNDFSGPFDMQLDAARGLLYVADFRASVVRVVDLRGLFTAGGSLPRVAATLGTPYFGGDLN